MKRKFLAIVLTAVMVLVMAMPAFADAETEAKQVNSRRVVTLGADLSTAQQEMMMRYFGVTWNEVDIIHVNNTQERYYLGAYVPSEQIGWQTMSCAYVNPTTSGGIKVKTANLNWVTCNMIATTLSTSGVTNCQVIAAAPFSVSGTGALTGIILAYQQASGITLDPAKIDLANREMVVTANLSDNVGQSNAIAIVNEAKYEVIENNITNITDITNVVNNISNEYNVEINESEADQIAELVAEIVQQDYEIEELKKTLASVQANVISDTNAPEEVQAAVAERNDEIIAEEQEKAEEEKAAAEGESTEGQSENTEGQPESQVEEQDLEPEEEEIDIFENTDATALSGTDIPLIESDTNSTVAEQKEAAEEMIAEGLATDVPGAPEEAQPEEEQPEEVQPEEEQQVETQPEEGWYEEDTTPEGESAEGLPEEDDWTTFDGDGNEISSPEEGADTGEETPGEGESTGNETSGEGESTGDETAGEGESAEGEGEAAEEIEEVKHTEEEFKEAADAAVEGESVKEAYDKYDEFKTKTEEKLNELYDITDETKQEISELALQYIIDKAFEEIDEENSENAEEEAFLEGIALGIEELAVPEEEAEDKEYRRKYENENEDPFAEEDPEETELYEFMSGLEEVIYDAVEENEELTDEQEQSLYELFMDAAEEVYMPEEAEGEETGESAGEEELSAEPENPEEYVEEYYPEEAGGEEYFEGEENYGGEEYNEFAGWEETEESFVG